ncbi:hypothetical protein F5Y18DRAFT_204260 [Xylariaceae sp. FL1019]|nr:hypothetical protein F5Y18DRAFT_204260 [Xylariaceae sp. FL1019]
MQAQACVCVCVCRYADNGLPRAMIVGWKVLCGLCGLCGVCILRCGDTLGAGVGLLLFADGGACCRCRCRCCCCCCRCCCFVCWCQVVGRGERGQSGSGGACGVRCACALSKRKLIRSGVSCCFQVSCFAAQASAWVCWARPRRREFRQSDGGRRATMQQWDSPRVLPPCGMLGPGLQPTYLQYLALWMWVADASRTGGDKRGEEGLRGSRWTYRAKVAWVH